MSISLTGLASNYALPGNYVQINFAQGPASLGSANYSAIIFANILSSGTASTATASQAFVYGPTTTPSLQTEQDAINLFGAGSEAQIVWSAFTNINKVTPLYVAPIATASGAAATSTISFTITNAASTNVATAVPTSSGSVTVFVAENSVSIGFSTTDTATSLATNIVNAINSQVKWAVTASAAAATWLSTVATVVITLTAKTVGYRGNFINFNAVVSQGSNGVASSVTAPTSMSSGSGVDSNAYAIGGVASTRYYYQISADGYNTGAGSETNLKALSTQITTNALPTNGIRERWFAGSNDSSVANASFCAEALNDVRGCLVWQQSSDYLPCVLASKVAACVSLLENGFNATSLNFDGVGITANTAGLLSINAPRSGIVATPTNLNTALNTGVTPIASTNTGTGYITKLITTYCENVSASNVFDYRVRDYHKVSTADRFSDDLISVFAASCSGKTVAPDPKQNEPPPPNAITPSVLKGMINRLERDYYQSGLLININSIINGTLVQYNQVTAPNVISALVPLQIISVLDQTQTVVNQIS
jgi:phage tail sheath gpL-like